MLILYSNKHYNLKQKILDSITEVVGYEINKKVIQ